MRLVSTRLDISGQQRFAMLMIALSVAIFVAVLRDERKEQS
jgi:hypothetical protein